jgi:hypothetical protein
MENILQLLLDFVAENWNSFRHDCEQTGLTETEIEDALKEVAIKFNINWG